MKILITNSQGLGDEILYLAGAKVLLKHLDPADELHVQCSNRLASIVMRDLPEAIPCKADKSPDKSAFDAVIPNDALPRIHTGAYLTSRAKGEHYFKLVARKPLVGFSWYSQNHATGPMKSTTVDKLRPLLSEDCGGVCLQYGDCKMELAAAGLTYDINVDTLCDPLRDLEAYFDLVDACETVVTTSNTTLHVAGALGKRTFLLAPADQEGPWYWRDMPYESVTVCFGSGEEWASQAVEIARLAM